MKKYALIFLFLLFDLFIINGHTLAKIEMLDKKPVYEVKDGDSSLIITHPKDARPTLREIVYFHVIEKPYDDLTDPIPEVKIKPTVEKPRSFTNGHGYQYLNEDDDSGELSAGDDNDDSERPDEENNTNDKFNNDSERPDDENNTNDKLDSNAFDDIKDQKTGAEADIEVPEKSAITNNDDEFTNYTDTDNKVEFPNDIGDEYQIIDDENDNLQKSGHDNEPIADDTDVRFGNDTDNTPIIEATVATQEEQKRRRKREIDYSNLPDAPTLPELNLDIFPDYIKAILMKEPVSIQQAEKTENLEEEMEKEVKQLEKAVNHPPEERDSKSQKRKARTYGMSLTGDSGVVWNDVSAPHVTYRIGQPENNSSTTFTPEEVSTTTIRPITMNEPAKDNEIEQSDEINENVDSSEIKDIEASFGEIEKMLDELIKESTSKPDVSENKDETSKKPDIRNDITTEMIPTETLNKNGNSEDELSTQKPDNKITPDSSEAIPEDEKNTNKEKNKYNEDSKQKQFVMELMKNKYFWQWLQDSSTAYLQVMMKKIDVLIKAEVDKQIKQYFKEHKITDGNVSNVTQKPNISSTLENGNITDTTTTQNPIINNTTEQNIPAEEDKPINDNIETEELAMKNNNKESNEKPDPPVKIEAQTLYGNSVGNGKVTNIFIFNISKESDLKNIKSLNNGTNGVFVFGLEDKKLDEAKKDQDQDEDETENSKYTTTKPEITKDQIANYNNISHESNLDTNHEPENIIDDSTSKENETNEPNSNDNNMNATPKPDNDKETATSTEKAIEEPPNDLSKESVTEESEEKPVTEKEEEKPVLDKPKDTNLSLSDIENNSSSSDASTLPNNNNEDAAKDKPEEMHDNEDKADITETPNKEHITSTDDTNASDSTNNGSDEASETNTTDNTTNDTNTTSTTNDTNTTSTTNDTNTTESTYNDKVSTDSVADTETTGKDENNSKENEIDHND